MTCGKEDERLRHLRKSNGTRCLPWGIYICAILDKELYDLNITSGTGRM